MAAKACSGTGSWPEQIVGTGVSPVPGDTYRASPLVIPS